MPNRILKDSIKLNDQIDQLSWFEEVVYYRLIVSADDYGCCDGRSIVLKNDLFPTKENVTKKAIEDAIRKLASVDLLHCYEVSGKPYLLFPTWKKHQRIRNKRHKYPEPPESYSESDCGQMSADCGQLTADCQPESESNPNTNPNTNPREKARAARFAPPTVQEVQDFVSANGFTVDANYFVDYYTSNGWKVGKNPMKNWQATVRRWQRREEQPVPAASSPIKPNPALNYDQRQYTEADFGDDFFIDLGKEYGDDKKEDDEDGKT